MRVLYSTLIYYLFRRIERPTRADNILDIILTTKGSLVSDMKVGFEFSSSNHWLITSKIQFHKVIECESKEKYWIIEKLTSK